MEKIVKNLTKIASSLDSQNRIKLASKIDKFTNDLVNIKTAQYVGVQGYWIRNERCWSNCYRQKRAESPKKASQVVWQECQNEYVESINNPTSGWEKYAQGTKQIKLSEANKKIIQAEKEFFNKTVAEKVEHGVSPNVAVYYTIEERKAEYAKEQIKLANSMLEFAEEINQKGFKKEAKSLALEANELIKEAGFFSDVWSGLKGEGKVYQQAQAIFTNNISALNNTLQQFKQNPQVGFQKRNIFTKQMQTTMRNLQGFLGKTQGLSSVTSRGVWELTTDFMNQATPIATAISSAGDIASFSQAVDNGIAVLNTFVQEVPAKIEQQVELLGQEQRQEQRQQQEQPQEQSSPVENLRVAIMNNGDILAALSALPDNFKSRAIQMLSQNVPIARAADESYFRLIKKSQEMVNPMNDDQIFNELMTKIPPDIAQQFISQQGQPSPQAAPTDQSSAIQQVKDIIMPFIYQAAEGKDDKEGHMAQVDFLRTLLNELGFSPQTLTGISTPKPNKGQFGTRAESYFSLVK
ncbi:MAG TPA: hypothetical protein VMX17_05445 [Candidatus Glassbacteria bacterium]|nr:hypothetical protein [Candidatus Glassbacteria bacterium]